ncbi:MAG: AAA family ATPase [Oscillatoriales cyanobacterium C42_A2020_001]|nr:AAA family ATPase [Leptolyngbyaceae cyanobacterium C42_A2020_001]
MARLLLLIGLPGSGKSTLAKELIQNCPEHRLISTDAIRAELYGDENVQGSWLVVWREVEQQFCQAVQHIRTGKASEAIYDATNVVRKQRRQAIALARASGFTHITGLWLNTPIWLCIDRNRQRDRQVPKEVIYRMNRRLCGAPPSMQEGMDELVVLSNGLIAGKSSEIAD